jgi:anti-sigma regulatory factor (Ser/Thr protein kinase)
MRLELPDEAWTVPLCRHVVLAVLHDLAVDAERVADIELVLSETTGNVIRHAYDHPGHHYRVALEVFADRICFQVEDEGCGFDPAVVPAPALEEAGGRGLWLIEQLADTVTLRTLPGGGCRLDVEFRRQSVQLSAIGYQPSVKTKTDFDFTDG